MKKFLEKHAAGLFISLLASAAVILGLCGWIYLDFVGEGRREELYRSEADSTAYRLIDSLEAGDAVLSYHYARLIREHAARSGEAGTARIFAGLSETIRITGVTDDMLNTVESYLNHSDEPADYAESEEIRPEVADAPEEVTALRRNDALAAAEEIVGTSGILTEAVRCRDGVFMFSCRNAYAMIDEKTSLPLEIGISLSEGDGTKTLTAEDCREAADRFLRKYFPAVDFQTIRLYPSGRNCVTVEYRIEGRTVTASVRCDTGRVVRYSAG